MYKVKDRLTNVNGQLEFEFFVTIPSLSYRDSTYAMQIVKLLLRLKAM